MSKDNKTITTERFSQALNRALFEKYGRSPSSTLLANDFNLRAYGTTTITRETARKWMRGLAIPEASKLKTLSEWLDLDLGSVFKTINDETALNQNPTIDPNEQYQKTLYTLVKDLDDKSKQAVLLTAWSLREIQSNKNAKLNYHKLPYINANLLGLLRP